MKTDLECDTLATLAFLSARWDDPLALSWMAVDAARRLGVTAHVGVDVLPADEVLFVREVA